LAVEDPSQAVAFGARCDEPQPDRFLLVEGGGSELLLKFFDVLLQSI
jgi:hypothetical protein